MIKQGITTVLGRLNDCPVLLAPEGEAIGTGDSLAEQALDGTGHLLRIHVRAGADRHLLVRRGLADAGHRPGPPMEDGDVLGDGDLVSGPIERLEVRVIGVPVGIAQLRPRQLELRAQLDEGQNSPLQALYAPGRCVRECARAPEVRGRVVPPVRT